MNNKRLAHNMIANLFSFGLNILVSFFLSPYIVRNLGKEAYGFVAMITNFLQMSQIVTVAINSMGARFVTIAIHKGEDEKAKKYFSSMFLANLVISVVVLIVCAIVSLNISGIFDVPTGLIYDVRTSFLISGLAFSLALTFSVYTISTYAKNRLDISAWRDMFKQIIRAAVILVLFTFFSPSIVYVSVASLCMEIYYLLANRKITRKLLPDFRIKPEYFSFSALFELISSGIWNSIGRLSYSLLNDLDLIVANIFINASAMGIMSIAKTVPGAINSLVTTIVGVFLPSFTISFAKNDINGMLHDMKKGIKIISIIIAPILCFLIAFGEDFYSLWQPTQDAKMLQTLSVLAILPLYFTLGMKSVNNVFSITNHLKYSTVATFIASLVTIGIEFTLLKFTNLGVIAIAATSSVCLIIKELTFIPLYAAKCLNIKWYTFYPQVITEFFIIVVSIVISVVIHYFLPAYSWITLILYGALSSIIIVVINSLLLLRKDDYAKIFAKLHQLGNR